MQRLKPSVQCYAWGKVGDTSQVAQLASADEEFTIEPNQTYAELWMGTHGKGPSRMASTGQALGDWLAVNSDCVGKKLLAKLKTQSDSAAASIDLPLLFKVLSVNKALSIQSHPTKSQAEQLHASDPTNYPDANHKPEMAIALSPFEMLCGFKPIEQIHQNIVETPELFEFIGSDAFMLLEHQAKLPAAQRSAVAARDALQQCFTRLMTQPELVVQRNVRTLVDRVALYANSRQERGELPSPNEDSNYVRAELIIRLNQHYPGDIGVFAPLLLNHFILQPGQSCFLAPNEPHAYLFGDCIECMACSDNTIRAGLTPKYKDVSTLCASLTYRMAAPEDNMFQPYEHKDDASVLVYEPPVPEFVVHRIKVTNAGAYNLLALGTCSLLLVIEGQAQTSDQSASSLNAGHVMLVSAGVQPISMQITHTPFIAFRAFTSEQHVNDL